LVHQYEFFSRPLGFQVSEAISIKNGVIDGYDGMDGLLENKMNGVNGHEVPNGHKMEVNPPASDAGEGGEQQQLDSEGGAPSVKTYVVVSEVVQRSLPVQVGDRVVRLNGQEVSSWSFWELTHKLKHLPVPLTLEFMKTSQRVLQVLN
jgi:hypothetical protein